MYSKPTYSNGKLILAGNNLTEPGEILDLCFDSIYISAFVQVFSIISRKFWFFFLLIPGFGLWKLWSTLIRPWLSMRGNETEVEDEDDENENKKKKKKHGKKIKIYK
ncbi:transmembrane protein [Anaeramoeba ignava]|uniref:Transmembrane protein n=1 Tax=Anaeramoeba ignava TaxID=1746090 RepID=A0A9Q0RA37_ANAIG|nr:transmembrane protein [Anaeramoeba ignava]